MTPYEKEYYPTEWILKERRKEEIKMIRQASIIGNPSICAHKPTLSKKQKAKLKKRKP